jgi:putative spermidine/putrescine transport system substrate-binding protein
MTSGPISTLTRRGFVKATAGATLSIGVVGPSRAASNSLVSTVFGGAYEREYRKAILEPFERETGIKVVAKLGMTSEWLTNALVNRRRPEIDVLLLPYPDNVKAVAEGISLPITAQDVPNMKDVDAIWTDQFRGMGVALDYVGYGIAYRTDLVPKHRRPGRTFGLPPTKAK